MDIANELSMYFQGLGKKEMIWIKYITSEEKYFEV